MNDCVFEGNTCARCGRVTLRPDLPRNCRPNDDFEQPQPLNEMPERNAPGFLEKVKNFAVAAAGHVAAGMPMASDEEIVRRHDICLQCEHLVNGACSQCGCPISRIRGYVSKLSWADSECPVGKWGKAEPPKEGPPPTS